MKPSDFQLGSLASRAAARAQLERVKQGPEEVISIRVVYIGYDGKEPLPSPQRIPWKGGVTEIVHVAD
jgi:hypothetical protein